MESGLEEIRKKRIPPAGLKHPFSGLLRICGPPLVQEELVVGGLPGRGGFVFKRSLVSIEERQGIVDQVNDKGIVLSGARLSYSKWFEGERPTEDALGHQVTVIVDAGDKCTFLKKIVRLGEKANGWKPPEPRQMGSFG